MQPTELVTLNMRELDRLKVIQAVVDCLLKTGLAAERLSICRRPVELPTDRRERDPVLRWQEMR